MAVPPTHTVDIYRPTITRGAKNEEIKTWPATATISGLPWNLQPAGAGLVKRVFGRYVEGMWLAIASPGDTVTPGDGVRVVGSLLGGTDPPGRFEIERVDPWGGAYQQDVMMAITGENFG